MSQPAIEIVPIRETHIASYHAAWDKVARERRFLFLQAAPPLEEVADFVRSNLREGNPHFVALADDRVVGWCDIIRYTHVTTRHRGALTLAVLPSNRQHGLGARLLAPAIAEAWQQGFLRIDLVVRSFNVNAVALYRRFGFEQEGLRRKASCVDGEYCDLLDMALLHPDLAIH